MKDATEILKAIRKVEKLTQKQFADRIGLKQSTYTMIESGKNKPSVDFLRIVTKEFGISPMLFFSNDNDSIIDDILNTNNDYLNSMDNDYLNSKKGGDTVNLKQTNTEFLKTKVTLTDKFIEEIIGNTYSIDQLSAKTKKLRELAVSYNLKIDRELRNNHKDLYKTMEQAADLDALCDLIWTMVSAHINVRPNPFDAFQYLDLQNKTENIPDTIDYKNYKKEVIDWLEKIKKYQDITKEFYNHGEHFLKQIKPLDTDGIID